LARPGGIYRTNDAGAHWQPVFDGQSIQSIGSLAVVIKRAAADASRSTAIDAVV
jgi:hypothetical protein